MKRKTFIDEHLAHDFINEEMRCFLEQQKLPKLFEFEVEYSFFTTPGAISNEDVAYQKIKDGAFILSGTLYFLSFSTKDKKQKRIPFAMIYRNDFNYSVVILFEQEKGDEQN